jgi:hypothetical protein
LAATSRQELAPPCPERQGRNRTRGREWPCRCDRLQEIELEQDGKRFLLRTPTTGVVGKLFQAVGVALPSNLQELPLTTPQPAA